MSDILSKQYVVPILSYLYNGSVKMTDLQSIVSNYSTLRLIVRELQDVGYVSVKEIFEDKRKIIVSLTEKGKAVASQLAKAEDIAKGKMDFEIPKIELTDEEVEKAKNLTLLYHVNVMDDHVTVEELRPGKRSRVFNIYIKKNGHDYFRLWCEQDNSFDCWHARTAWAYPQVQAMIMHYKGKTKVCQICGYENPENAIYCMKCGKKLE